MAHTPEHTIEEATRAYREGDAATLSRLLADDVRVLGSEWGDDWQGREQADEHLAGELALRRSVSGPLVEAPFTVDTSDDGNMAWSSRKGRLYLDDKVYEASWTTVLRKDKEDWKIVHSHFSIHR